MDIPNKFDLKQKENLFLAKKNLVDYIWKSANLEGINITFPDTYTIVEKLSMQNADIADVNTILNLKHAWQEVFKTYNEELTLEYILKIHSEVSKDEALTWGELRTGKVGISGTDYIPEIPKAKLVKNSLRKFNEIECDTERILKLMLWMMKSQLFWDGNKRTAMIIANKELIKHGRGIVSVAIKDISEFNKLLSDYYSYDKDKELLEFLYNKCLQGIEY